jgi:hypothetical protein
VGAVEVSAAVWFAANVADQRGIAELMAESQAGSQAFAEGLELVMNGPFWTFASV